MKKVIIAIFILLAIIVFAVLGALVWYNSQLIAVNENEVFEKKIEIQSGMSTDEILDLLQESQLIKSKLVAKLYIKLNGINNLQAGKYTLNSSMDLEQILKQISSGKVIDESITVTFLEGKNMRWFAKRIAEETNNTEKDVYDLLENKEYINSLIQKYWFLTDEVNNQEIYYPLEGYLYPDTYKLESKNVSVKQVFETLLNQTDTVLSKYKTQIQQNGKSVHEILTIASVIEMEGNDEESRRGIASVINNRLRQGMSLGSDVTTYYAIKVDVGERDLYVNEINAYNPYNTRGPQMNGKLPIGPISSVSEESIKATMNPLSTQYLYFVADINGKIHFTSTYEEHIQLVQDLKKQGLWYEY